MHQCSFLGFHIWLEEMLCILNIMICDENCLIHDSLCYDLYFNVSLCISYAADNFVAQYFSPCGSSFKFINGSHIHMFLVFYFLQKCFILNKK